MEGNNNNYNDVVYGIGCLIPKVYFRGLIVGLSIPLLINYCIKYNVNKTIKEQNKGSK